MRWDHDSVAELLRELGIVYRELESVLSEMEAGPSKSLIVTARNDVNRAMDNILRASLDFVMDQFKR